MDSIYLNPDLGPNEDDNVMCFRNIHPDYWFEKFYSTLLNQ